MNNDENTFTFLEFFISGQNLFIFSKPLQSSKITLSYMLDSDLKIECVMHYSNSKIDWAVFFFLFFFLILLKCDKRFNNFNSNINNCSIIIS